MSNCVPTDSRLRELQQWMQAVITNQDRTSAHLLASEAVRTDGLAAAERLAIYSRSYQVRLLQCFQAIFPALRHALGDDIFARFVCDFLSYHPPTSYSLNQIADAFPQHLSETRPDSDSSPDEREQWPDFIIDLATLELAFLKVFDGPGLEDNQPCSLTDLHNRGTQSILKARPLPAPCLRIFAFRFPVHLYLLAARRGELAELPEPSESFVAMSRLDYRVKMHELSSEQYAFLKALDGKTSLADAIDQRRLSIDKATGWLADWIEKVFFETLK